MKKIESESIDIVLTDPPYEVLSQSHDILGETDMKELSDLFYQKMVRKGIALIFCGALQIGKWNNALTSAGFSVMQFPIIITHKYNCNIYSIIF